jgi:DNA-binding XRE family transcriptional regulator
MDYSTPEWFGELLKKRRAECGLTSYQAAEIMGVSQSTIIAMEKDGRFVPESAKKVTDVYDLPYELVEFVQAYYHKPKGHEKIKLFQMLRKESLNERRAN